MQPTDTLTTLFSHNLWANLRLLERCAALSSEQLDATISGAYGSIRDTLQHIVTGEQLYFSLISTGQRYDRPEDAPPLTIAEMTESVRTTGAGLIEWAPKVQADDTVQPDGEGTLYDVPKTIILTQAINHATEHRAQIMAILTQLGIQPPELDSWTYFDEREKAAIQRGGEVVQRIASPLAIRTTRVKIGSIVIRCHEFEKMMAFWQDALHYVPLYSPEGGWVILGDPTGKGPNISLDKAPEKRTGRRGWLHLDLYTDDQEGEVERLLKIGATRYPWRYRPDDDFVVLEDPDGNLFCVVQATAGS